MAFEPQWRYHATQPARLVQSLDEAALHTETTGWYPSPEAAAFAMPPDTSCGLTDVLVDVDDPPVAVDPLPDRGTNRPRQVGRMPLHRKR